MFYWNIFFMLMTDNWATLHVILQFCHKLIFSDSCFDVYIPRKIN